MRAGKSDPGNREKILFGYNYTTKYTRNLTDFLLCQVINLRDSRDQKYFASVEQQAEGSNNNNSRGQFEGLARGEECPKSQSSVVSFIACVGREENQANAVVYFGGRKS